MSEILAVTSGKGGVGKTTVALQLALAHARRQHDTVLVDASFGLACVDIFLGLHAPRDIGTVLRGQASVEEVLVCHAEHLQVLAGVTGAPELAALDGELCRRFTALVHVLASSHDAVVVDAVSGMHAAAIAPLTLADRVVVVLTPDPAAIVGAYVVGRNLAVLRPNLVLDVVANQVEHPSEGEDAFWRLAESLRNHAGTRARYLGSVPWDPLVRESVALQTPVLARPDTPGAAAAFAHLEQELLGAPPDLPERAGNVVPIRPDLAGVAPCGPALES